MTPERIAEIAELHTVSPTVQKRMERAIRQAVNEFAEETATKIDEKCASYAKDYAVPDAYECIDIVRALKLPEEP